MDPGIQHNMREPTCPGPGAVADVGETGVVETHISILCFVADRVYKLRKAVQFGFLDFRLRTTRQRDCEREVALNRRLAPDVYSGVAEVHLNGEVIDHMVVMRRLPLERRLAVIARRGEDLGEWLEKVARVMASFHRDALRSREISIEATGAALHTNWEANFSDTEPFLGSILDAEVDQRIRSLAAHWIDGRHTLLEARIATGRICDGHGDLQAEDIFCLEDGVRILDCVEFSDRLRYGDVCADVAFLAMDLERLGRADASRKFLDDYQAFAGDQFPASLVHHYVALRAYIRAKVACLRVEQGHEGSRAEACQLHLLALEHLARAQVRLVLIGGLPGSGKSTVAAGVAHELGWGILRSDEVRRGMFVPDGGDAPPFGSGRYAPGLTAKVYTALLTRSEKQLLRGESVILDASWIDARWREAARDVAQRTGGDLVELCCVVRTDVAERRIAQRLSEGLDVSEATPAVRVAMGDAMDPWSTSRTIDTTEASEAESIARALEVLGGETGQP
jgi:aminoglycoside phosphotransferase family enzyme/predicted kinase